MSRVLLLRVAVPAKSCFTKSLEQAPCFPAGNRKPRRESKASSFRLGIERQQFHRVPFRVVVVNDCLVALNSCSVVLNDCQLRRSYEIPKLRAPA